jgi:hypothetical protein
MNFGQALAALITGGRLTCPELNQPGAYLGMEQPGGNITEPFIALHRSNGVVIPWTPTQEAILGKSWSMAGTNREAASQTQNQPEHASTR